MAQVVEELPKRKGGGKGRAEKYPYDEWLDGKIWRLEEGEDKDFQVTKLSFMTSIRGAAKKRGLKLRSRVLEDAVVVQAFSDNGNTESLPEGKQSEKSGKK